jgi:hypothetical protein
MIQNKLLLVALIAASILVPMAVQAQGISIEIGDRPYYNHGPHYWAGDYQMIWVPGHRYHGGWTHGHYVRSHSRHHYNTHTDDRRYDDSRVHEDYRR